jgi:PEP-CTERM motif
LEVNVRHHTARASLIVGLLGVSLAGLVPEARGSSILAGTDYISTPAGSSFDFGPGIGTVTFQGRFGPGVADTMITRLDNAILPNVGDTDTVRLQMRLLELMSVAPVNIGGSFFDVFVSLDPNARSLGEMTIHHEFPDDDGPAPEGTFTSMLSVHFIASFVPVLGGNPTEIKATLDLTSLPTQWSHEPPPGVLLVIGPPVELCATPGAASCYDPNFHVPLLPGFKDFFIPGGVIEQHPGAGVHQGQPGNVACDPNDPHCNPQGVVPEPGTIVLLASGLGMIATRARRSIFRQ